MKLVTFGIDNQRNLIVHFPVFVQPYTQRRLVRYQIETVPVPILHRNDQVQSYTQSKIDKPYIALMLYNAGCVIFQLSRRYMFIA